jgi:hypothetical protein
MQRIETFLTSEQLDTFSGLNTPFKIQAYLDSMPYNREDRNRSPLAVIQDQQCHCLDGSILAAAALRRLGFKPALMEMRPDKGADDEHVLALYQVDGHWGALAKSNFPGLRFREPIYRSLRELVLSYFESYITLQGKKTLRAYTSVLDLTRFDHNDWEVNESAIDCIDQEGLLRLRSYPLISVTMAASLNLADERSLKSAQYGTDPNEVYPGTGGGTD